LKITKGGELMAKNVYVNLSGNDGEIIYKEKGKTYIDKIEESKFLDANIKEKLLKRFGGKVNVIMIPKYELFEIETEKKIQYSSSYAFSKSRLYDEGYYIVNKNDDLYDIRMKSITNKAENDITLLIYNIKNSIVEKIFTKYDHRKINIKAIYPIQEIFSRFQSGELDNIILQTDLDAENRKIVRIFVYVNSMLVMCRVVFYDLYEGIVEEELERTVRYCESNMHKYFLNKVYIVNSKWDLHSKFNPIYKAEEIHEEEVYEKLFKTYNKEIKKVNFLPITYKAKEIFNKITKVFVVLLMVYSIFNAMKVKNIGEENKNNKYKIDMYKIGIEGFEKTNEGLVTDIEADDVYVAFKKDVENIKQFYIDTTFSYSKFLNYLNKNLNENIRISKIVTNDNNISIIGQAKKYRNLIDLSTELERSKMFSKIVTVELKKDMEEDIVIFEVECHLESGDEIEN